MRIWAYGTSPHGLGLDPVRFWHLSIREFIALKRIHREALLRWATERAMYANVNFVERDSSGNPIGVPFLAEDFLGEGNRQARLDERAMSQFSAAQVNAQLEKIKKGDTPEGLPAWATGIYG